MDKKLVIFDIFGTLIDDKMVNDAQIIRNKVLDLNINPSEEDKAKDSHYKIIQETINNLFYVPEEINIKLIERSNKERLYKEDWKKVVQTFLFALGFQYLLNKEDKEKYLIKDVNEVLDHLIQNYNIITLSNVVYPIQDTIVSAYNLPIKYKAGHAMNLIEDELAKERLGNEKFKKIMILEENNKYYNLDLSRVIAVVGDDLIKDGIVAFYLSKKYNKPIMFYHYTGEGSNKTAISYRLEDLINEVKNSNLPKLLNLEQVEKEIKEWYSKNYKQIKNLYELKKLL
ncbi:MAG: hypothetical protein ABGW69_03470 [Nanoarchaeota archaeon]